MRKFECGYGRGRVVEGEEPADEREVYHSSEKNNRAGDRRQVCDGVAPGALVGDSRSW